MSGPRLTVFLGAGGVGKTTLAAAHALALARNGRRVGLLGIDPSRRLQSALGLELSDRERPIPNEPRCLASVLAPAESLRRWTEESCSPEESAALFANPFFVALADRLAAATDVVAAVRVAEWTERDPLLTDLVVDTAPGLNAIEFLRRPRRLAVFLEGDLVRWLRGSARSARQRWLLGRLTSIGGARLLRDFAAFVQAIERPVEKMLGRIAEARRCVEESANIILVTTVRDDAATTAGAIAEALAAEGVAPSAVLVNRAVPSTLQVELDAIGASASPLVRYARAYAMTQARVVAAVRPLASAFATVPLARGLDELERVDVLARLGQALFTLDSPPTRSLRRVG